MWEGEEREKSVKFLRDPSIGTVFAAIVWNGVSTRPSPTPLPQLMNAKAKPIPIAFLSLLAGIGATALTSCGDDGVEELGEDIDDAVEDAGDALDDAADSVEDAVD